MVEKVTTDKLLANTSLSSSRGTRFWNWILQGMGFAGARDYYATFGWNKNRQFEDYLFRYLKQDIAKRIINAPVEGTWSDPPAVDADATFMTAWNNLTTTHRVWYKLAQLDILCGIGRFAVMLIGIDDNKDLALPVSPVTRVGNSRKVTYLQPYMESSVRITEWETNQFSPRFGLPTMYRIDPTKNSHLDSVGFSANLGSNQGNTIQNVRSPFNVHYTRILHIADNMLENAVYGCSRLEHVSNLLDDLLKVVGGSSETYWNTANRGLHADVDKDMQLDPDDAKNLKDEFDDFQNNLRRVIRTRGVKVTSLGSDVADPQGNFQVLLALISAATSIPQRILVGSEAGELASQQDRSNWAVSLAARESRFAQPIVLLPFINTLIVMGVLPHPTNLQVTWPEAFKLSPLERAQTSAQMARSAANLQKMISDPIGAVEVTETITTFDDLTSEAPVGTPATTTRGTTTLGDNLLANAFPPAGGGAVPPKNSKVTVRKWIEGGKPLFTREEARNIVGFGKTMPVFDSPDDTGSQTSQDTH